MKLVSLDSFSVCLLLYWASCSVAHPQFLSSCAFVCANGITCSLDVISLLTTWWNDTNLPRPVIFAPSLPLYCFNDTVRICYQKKSLYFWRQILRETWRCSHGYNSQPCASCHSYVLLLQFGSDMLMTPPPCMFDGIDTALIFYNTLTSATVPLMSSSRSKKSMKYPVQTFFSNAVSTILSWHQFTKGNLYTKWDSTPLARTKSQFAHLLTFVLHRLGLLNFLPLQKWYEHHVV